MSGLQIALLIGAILVSQVVIWVPIVGWLRRRSRALIVTVQEELSGAGENVLRGPEAASYRGASGGHPKVKGNGVIALSDKRLVFRFLVGGRPIDVATAEITGIRYDKWFVGAYRGGQLHLIVELADGKELGFFVDDEDAWKTALLSLSAR